MRFGESFPSGADKKNRMDVLKKNEKPEENPSYIEFGLEIRNILKAKVEQEGWPPLPDSEKINLTEDIFEAAKNEVNKTWEGSVQNLIFSKVDEWKENIKGENPELEAALNLLNNPEELSKSFSTRQFGVLETLRTVNPEAWRSLVMASSERQLASIAIMEHWLKYSDQNELTAVVDKTGVSQEELRLFVDLAAILGKYIDHTYVKQIELADLPGGSEETKHGEEDGVQYLYDLYKDPKSEDIDFKTYTEIFPYEWEKIQARLEKLSEKTKLAGEKGELPTSYLEFAKYLEKFAHVYGSKSITLAVLDKEWEDLYKTEKEVDETDCPIMLVPQGCSSVAGEAGKVDAEMRFGLKTKETKERENNLNKFTLTAQEILDSYRDSLGKDYKVPTVNLNYQPWAFGPNLYWMTRGESSESQILSHTNAVTEVALVKEVPLLQKIFKGEKITNQEYAKAAVVETVLHETGHNVLDSEDKKVSKRIGSSFEAGILEELKAETVGVKILLETARQGSLPTDINFRNQLLAKLGTNLDYLKNKSDKKAGAGEPYYICGATIIGALLDRGLIIKTDSGYEIGDPEAGLKEISDIGDKILSLYTNSETKPADVKNYVKELRTKSQETALRDLISRL